jgi:hypothetical protein
LPFVLGDADHGAPFLEKFREGFAVFRNGVVANEYATKIWAYPPGRPCQQVHMPDPWLRLPWNQVSMLCKTPAAQWDFSIIGTTNLEPPWRFRRSLDAFESSSCSASGAP